jgi:hypothetical protein
MEAGSTRVGTRPSASANRARFWGEQRVKRYRSSWTFMSSVTDFYVQEVYRVGYKSYKHYERSELSIETSVPYMPFVDFPFDFPKSSGGIVRNKMKMRQEAEEELSDVLGRKTSETRRRVIPQYNDLMEFNPYSVSTSDDYYQTAADFFHGPE